MKTRLLLLTLSLLLAACASTHPGQEATSLSAAPSLPLKVSARNIDEDRKDPFQLVEITFENVSDNWVRLSKSQVVISNPAKSRVSVVMGQDLLDWAQAMELKKKKEEQNKKMLQLGLIVAGAAVSAVGSANDNPAVAGAGAAAVIGTSVWSVADSISTQKAAAEGVNHVPDTHLYHSVMIPGSTFVRRWVLLNKPANNLVKKMRIQVESVEGAKEIYELSL